VHSIATKSHLVVEYPNKRCVVTALSHLFHSRESEYTMCIVTKRDLVHITDALASLHWL